MFQATQITLGEGQSYEDVKVLSYNDLIAHGRPTPFETRTMGFDCRGMFYLVHIWNIISIKYDKIQRGGPGFAAARIIISGDANYDNVHILDQDNWIKQGIPYVLETDDGITAQMVFSCADGTFIALDKSVTSIAIKHSHSRMRKATQIIDSHATSIKKADLPQTIHGRITH